MNNFNRVYNSGNPNQGQYKKVLCVCSAGLLRSPTAAMVLASDPYNFNTRAVGVDADHALIPIDEVHLGWADEVVVMDQYQMKLIYAMFPDFNGEIIVLDIPDRFRYRDPELIELIKQRYDEADKGQADDGVGDE